MNFRNFTKRAIFRHERRRGSSRPRDMLAIGVKLFAGVALLTIMSPRDLYAQDTGIRVGAFLLHPSFSADYGYNDNVANTNAGGGGSSYSLRGGLSVESNWNRHSLTGSVNASLGGDSEGTGCDCGIGVGIGTRLDAIGEPNAPKSLSFGIAAGVERSPGASSRNGVLLAERSYEYTSRFGASTQGRVNRFYGSASGEYLLYRYANAVLRPGQSSTFFDSHRDRSRAKVALNGGYEISPNLRVVGNFDVAAIRHDHTNVGRIDFNVTTGTAGVEFSIPDSNIGGDFEIGAQHVCGKGVGNDDLKRTNFTSTGSIDWELRRTVRLGAVLSRDFLASETEVQNNLGTDRIRLALTANTEVTQDVGLDIEGSVANLDHTVNNNGRAHVNRSDTQYSLSAETTYRFGRYYDARAKIGYSGLTSSDKAASYQSLYLGVGISGNY